MIHGLNQALPTAPAMVYVQQSAPYPMPRQAAMPVLYAVQQQAPPEPGWAVNGPVSKYSASGNDRIQSARIPSLRKRSIVIVNRDPQHFIYPPTKTVCKFSILRDLHHPSLETKHQHISLFNTNDSSSSSFSVPSEMIFLR